MSLPSPTEVVLQLSRLANDLDAKTAEIAQLDEEFVRAKSAFEVSFARKFLTTVGSMDVRKQTAVLETADVKLTAELAEAKVRAARESIKTLRDRLEVGRSVNAAVRTEFSVSGVGQP